MKEEMKAEINTDSRPKILFVDDEKHILSALERLFFDENYEIFVANSGADGLEILKQYPAQLIISDQRMPYMTGVDFLIQAKQLLPDSIRIVLTGYSDIEATLRAINEGSIYKFINKPWNDEELKLVVRQALDYHNLIKKNQEYVELIKTQNEQLKELNENLNIRVRERTKTILQKNQELSQLNKELTDSFVKVVRLMLNFIEMKSKELVSHSKRVAAASRFLATELGMSEEEIEIVEIGALLHDIGKISLPDKLITKNEAMMSPEEMNQWRQHSLAGARFLGNIERLEEICRIIRHHHENYNGSGFPDKLVGQEIPRASRIVAVIDTFDKLVNKIYLNLTNPRLRAIKALRMKMGMELDPDITNTFITFLYRQKEKLARKEQELRPFELQEDMILSRDLYTTRGALVFPKNKRLDSADIKAILDSDRLEKLFTAVYVFAK
jgi:putative nucleotidyltransferase with HDIG domain